MLNALEKIELLREYIQQKREQHKNHNFQCDTEASDANSRQLTNIGLFRAYAEAYLENLSHARLDDEEEPRIKTEGMTLLVRHREPTSNGLPIEIVAFCARTTWKEYEAVQADVFDHLIAILPKFGLQAFQNISDSAQRGAIGALEYDDTDAGLDPAAQSVIEEQNRRLVNSPNARVDVSIRKVQAVLNKHGIEARFAISVDGRTLTLRAK